MKIAWKLHIVDGKTTCFNEKGDGIVSIGPEGREPDRPIGTAEAYEVCKVNGAVLIYTPTADTQFVLIPE